MQSKLQYYSPESFWQKFKLWGQPVNVREQQDAFDFFCNLTDQVNERLKVIMTGVGRGKGCNGCQMIGRVWWEGMSDDREGVVGGMSGIRKVWCGGRSNDREGVVVRYVR